jgi:DNA-binding MarR family transcriptional regulator
MMAAQISEEMRSSGLDISREQGMALIRLFKKAGPTQSELAWITNRDKTSLTRLIAKMEDSDLIERKEDDKDKRIKRVFLTKKGRAMAEKVESILQSIAGKYIINIPDEEINEVITSLEKIQNQIKHQCDL